MKKILLILLFLVTAGFIYGQNTYYWVGGNGGLINTLASWNTSLNGSGSARTSNTNTADILIFDGTNLGGATPITGLVLANSTGSISCAVLKFVNNAVINMQRSAVAGTSTVTIAGDGNPTEDFVIETGCSLTIPSTATGSLRFAMAATNTGRVSGSLSMITGQQARIDNTTGGTAGSFVFTSGSSFTTNITAASASYSFGNSTQSSEKWVVFEAGSNLYYEGGFSPNGSGTLFSAIDMKPGSTWHHRATNPTASAGNFFNRKNFGNVIVENNATLIALGPIYSIENLTVNNGCSFTTFSSGQTVVLGNLVVDGAITTNAGSTNNLVLAGSSTQTISGAGTINVGGLIVADHADVASNRNINVENGATIYGRYNFNNYQLTGPGNFNATSTASSAGLTGNVTAGRYYISGVTGFNSGTVGLTVSGTGIAPNTNVVSYSSALDTIYISQPVQSTSSGVALTFSSQNATLATGNANGFDPSSGSVIVAGSKNYGSKINYIINAATATPFGISPAPNDLFADINDIVFNAAVTTNTKAHISGNLQLNSGKVTIRTTDTIHLLSTATLGGTFNSGNYFVTTANTTNGQQGIFRYDNISSAKLFPIGSANYYLPATITPASASDFATAVFEGITEDGTPNGVPLSSSQKQTRVDAVWNINRVNGSGNSVLELNWNQLLEGTTFSSFANSDIGIIKNQNPGWSLPLDTGDNNLNRAAAIVTSFGAFGIGAQPPAQAFVFNSLPVKTYGDPDFSGGAISLNTSQPITYTSSNLLVATIVNNNIHITGTGTTTITATQASDGFYPAVNVTQTLTVNKAPLTIKADDKTKPEGFANPTLTATYTGFVYGETSAVLLTQPVLATTAVTTSLAGTYPITVSGATAANYTITFVNGTMTITARQNQTITFPAFATKTYGNPDFAAGASSSNGSIPVTYVSSNVNVATIVGSNIHIVGAGTTTITASQAGNNFYFPAADVSRTLTVNKANLTVRAVDTTKMFGDPIPLFRLVYTGFVLGQTPTNLTTQPSATTAAGATSPPGYYSIDVSGGVSGNYNFIYTSGRLTIYPATGTAQSFIQVYQVSSNVVRVKIFSPGPDLADFVLYDLNGRPLLRKNVFLAQGFITSDLDVTLVPSGSYILNVVGKNAHLKKQFLLVH